MFETWLTLSVLTALFLSAVFRVMAIRYREFNKRDWLQYVGVVVAFPIGLILALLGAYEAWREWKQ